MPKARILEAVTEAKGAGMEELIEGLKKSDMAEQAERLLADTGWLPVPLRRDGPPRTSGVETASHAGEGAGAEPDGRPQAEPAADLPEFLTAAE